MKNSDVVFFAYAVHSGFLAQNLLKLNVFKFCDFNLRAAIAIINVWKIRTGESQYVRFSLDNLKLDDDVLNIPLFMDDQTDRLIGLALEQRRRSK